MKCFSTMDSIDYLAGQNHCSDADIVDFIHIYYANYIGDGNPGTRLSIQEMREIYEESQSLIADFRAFSQYDTKTSSPNNQPSSDEVKEAFLTQLPPHLKSLWKNLSPVRYQMRMLGDIGATLLFVSDIVNRTINTKSLDGFLGVDLGTGTGILLAAQNILAKKYRYTNHKLYGIEYDPDVAQKTKFFCQKLGYKILCGDTTDSSIWDQIPPGPIRFVSNENIPAAHERMDREPFLENMECLYEMRSDDIGETCFSPEKLEIIKDPRTCDQEVRYITSPENEFCTEEIGDDALRMEENGLGDLMTLLIPDKILLEGKSIPLRLVSKLGAERVGNFGYRRGFMSRF